MFRYGGFKIFRHAQALLSLLPQFISGYPHASEIDVAGGLDSFRDGDVKSLGNSVAKSIGAAAQRESRTVRNGPEPVSEDLSKRVNNTYLARGAKGGQIFKNQFLIFQDTLFSASEPCSKEQLS